MHPSCVQLPTPCYSFFNPAAIVAYAKGTVAYMAVLQEIYFLGSSLAIEGRITAVANVSATWLRDRVAYLTNDNVSLSTVISASSKVEPVVVRCGFFGGGSMYLCWCVLCWDVCTYVYVGVFMRVQGRVYMCMHWDACIYMDVGVFMRVQVCVYMCMHWDACIYVDVLVYSRASVQQRQVELPGRVQGQHVAGMRRVHPRLCQHNHSLHVAAQHPQQSRCLHLRLRLLHAPSAGGVHVWQLQH